MAHCLVNDTPAELDFRQETWGDLLDGLDRQLAAGGRVVTAVRFDGVDLPSFRESAAAGTLLDGIARIDAEAEDAAALVRAAVDSAAAYAARLSLVTDAATEGRVREACDRVAAALETLIARRRNGDAASLADALDGQLVRAIAAWGDVLAPIGTGGVA
jgi:hypothetical protein